MSKTGVGRCDTELALTEERHVWMLIDNLTFEVPEIERKTTSLKIIIVVRGRGR